MRRELFTRYAIVPIIVLFAFIAELVFVLNSMTQIRPEELSENVRNVYWFQQGLVFSGINAHLGWYASLALFYDVFGFSFENGQFFRLVLHLLSLLCIVLLLRAYFTGHQWLIPLAAIALSPTLLYFNTLKNHYGVDLQYVPICLYLLHIVNFKNRLSALWVALLWALSMFAWLSYPTFICFLPGLAILFYHQLRRHGLDARRMLRFSSIAIAAFLAPLIILVAHVENKNLLVYDDITTGGLFRGAGSLDVRSRDVLSQRVWMTALGFTGGAPSYYYEVNKADFSDLSSLLAIALAAIAGFTYFDKRGSILWIACALWTVILVNLATIALLVDPAGLSSVRRATPTIFCLYAFYALACLRVFQVARTRSLNYVLVGAVLLLLPLHHISVFPVNLSHLKDPSGFRYAMWFGGAETPSLALSGYVDTIQKEDLRLEASWGNNREFGTVFNWIYSSVSAACYWNRLDCHGMVAVDPAKNAVVPLTMENVNYVSKENWSS